jgi:hypothetical protein
MIRGNQALTVVVKLVPTFMDITENNKFLMIRGNLAHVCLPYGLRQTMRTQL